MATSRSSRPPEPISLPVREWEFVRRHPAGPVPAEVVAAISAALQGYFGEEPPLATEPVAAWGKASRREAIGEGPFTARADLFRR